MGSTSKKQREKALLANVERRSNKGVSVRRRPVIVMVKPEVEKVSIFTILRKRLKEIKERVWRAIRNGVR